MAEKILIQNHLPQNHFHKRVKSKEGIYHKKKNNHIPDNSPNHGNRINFSVYAI